MASPAINRGTRKALRTLVQMTVTGGLTGLSNVVINLAGRKLGPEWQVALAAGWLFVVTFAQNSAETAGIIPTLLPSPGLVTSAAGAVAATTVATVDAVTETVGDVTGVVGEVVDTAGQVVGAVTAPVGGLLDDILDEEKEADK